MALEMVELYNKASDLFGDFLVDYDVSVNDSSYSNVFLKHDVLYECQLKELLKREDEVLTSRIPKNFKGFKEYFSRVRSYEDAHRKNYQDKVRKKYKTRYGMKFTILLPKSISLKKDKCTLIKDFIKSINYDNAPLMYVVFEEKRGHGTYLCLYISDRAYINVERVVRYDRDYKSKDSLKKKGSIKRDQNGDIVKESLEFEKCKVSYFKYPENGFMPYIAKLKSYLIEVFKGLLTGFRRKKKSKNYEGKSFDEHKGFLIEKKVIYKRYHHKYRQALNEVNAGKRYVENMINGHIYMLNKELDRTSDGTLIKNESNADNFKKIDKLKSIFFKFDARFKKNAYHNKDKDEISLVIAKKNGNLPGIKKAIEELITLFNDDLLKVIPDALAFDRK